MDREKLVGVKGKPIEGQAREIINNVLIFMKKEAEGGLQIPIRNYRQRVISATGISKNTLHKIMQEAKSIQEGVSSSFSTPYTSRPRKKRKIDAVSLEDLEAIREIINNFYVVKKKRPSLKNIHEKIQDAELSFTMGKSTLWRLLKEMGYRWQKTEDNKTVLMEGHDVGLQEFKLVSESSDVSGGPVLQFSD